MELKRVRMVLVLGAVAALTLQTQAQSTQAPYSKMAAVDQYLIADRNAEITLARSAAPESIAGKAEVMVLGRSGFEIAVPERTISSASLSDLGTPPSAIPISGIPKFVVPTASMQPQQSRIFQSRS